MAQNCRRQFNVDLGLAVGRFPAFDTSAPEPKPMFVGLAFAGGVHVRSFPYAGHPATLKIFCAKRALNVARLALLERAMGTGLTCGNGPKGVAQE